MLNLTEEFKYIDEFFDNITDEELYEALVRCGLHVPEPLRKEFIEKNNIQTAVEEGEKDGNIKGEL